MKPFHVLLALLGLVTIVLTTFDVRNALVLPIILGPSLFFYLRCYRQKMKYLKLYVSQDTLAVVFLSGCAMAPVTGTMEALIVHGARFVGAQKSASANGENNSVEGWNNSASSGIDSNSVKHIMVLVLLSYCLAGFLEEFLKYLVIHLTENWGFYSLYNYRGPKDGLEEELKVEQGADQTCVVIETAATAGAAKEGERVRMCATTPLNIFAAASQQRPDTMRRKDPVKIMTLFIVVSLGFSAFENMLYLCFLRKSQARPSVPQSNAYWLLHAAKSTILTNGLHVTCALYISFNVFRRDFYGGHKMVQRGKGMLGTAHLLFPAIVMHGSFDFFSFAIKKPLSLEAIVEVPLSSSIASDAPRIICFVLQVCLLLIGLLHCEQIYKELNIWALSAAVRATDETDGITPMIFELRDEENKPPVTIMIV